MRCRCLNPSRSIHSPRASRCPPARGDFAGIEGCPNIPPLPGAIIQRFPANDRTRRTVCMRDAFPRRKSTPRAGAYVLPRVSAPAALPPPLHCAGFRSLIIEMKARTLIRHIGLIAPVFWPPILSAHMAEAQTGEKQSSFLEGSLRSRRQWDFRAHSDAASFGIHSFTSGSTSSDRACIQDAAPGFPRPGVSAPTHKEQALHCDSGRA